MSDLPPGLTLTNDQEVPPGLTLTPPQQSSSAPSSSLKSSEPSTSLSSLGKNFVAGLEEAPAQILSLADKANPFAPGVLSDVAHDFGHDLSHDVTHFISQDAVPAALNTFGWGNPGEPPQGLDPEKVDPVTTLDKISRGIGNALPLAPIGGVEGLAPNAARTVGAVTGSTLAQEAVPTPYKPLAALAGNLLGGAPEAPITAFRSAPTTAQRAGNYVSTLMDNAGKSGTDLRAAQTAKPVMAAETIGRSAVPALGALARRQGQTGDILGAALTERAQQAPERILNDYASASGIVPEAAQGNIDTLVRSGQANAKPLYKQAYTAPALNPDHIAPGGTLDNMMSRPSMVSAAKNALGIAAEEGRDPSSLGIGFNTAGDVQFERVPSWQTLDYMKRGLDQHLESFRNELTGKMPTGNPSVSAAQGTRTQFRNFLASENPAYGQALKTSGDYLSLQNAFTNGQKFILSSTMTADNLAKQFAKLSPAEQEAFKGGTANAIYNQAQNGRMAPRLFKAPAIQQKLNTVLGPKNAQTFLGNMQQEADMAKSGARMMPAVNSPTFELAEAAKDQDGSMIQHAITGLFAAKHAAAGNYLGAAAHASRLWHTLKNTGMSIPVRDEAGRLLMMKPEDLADELDNIAGMKSQGKARAALQKFTLPAEIGAVQEGNTTSP